jgi:hypothetical protein
MVNSVTGDGLTLKYNKHYIGLARAGIADNFVTFRARREYVIAEFRVPRSEDVTALVEESGVEKLPYDKRWGRYRLRLAQADIARHRDLLADLISRASGTAPPIGE